MGSMIPKNVEQVIDPRLDLAIQRTELALDRTQLSWARTVIGLIGAAVAVDKGLRLLHETRILSGQAWIRNGHAAGLAITVVSTILLSIVVCDYWKMSRQLADVKSARPKTLPPALVVSLIVILLGVGVFAILLADNRT